MMCKRISFYILKDTKFDKNVFHVKGKVEAVSYIYKYLQIFLLPYLLILNSTNEAKNKLGFFQAIPLNKVKNLMEIT